MVFLDMTAPIADGPVPGTYLARVKSAISKKSGAGSEMFSVELADAATDQKLCHDFIMLEGGGAALGRQKLLALGIPASFKAEIMAAELVGRLAYVALIEREYTDNKGVLRKNLSPDINDGAAGYWPSASPPPDLAARQAKIIASDDATIDGHAPF